MSGIKVLIADDESIVRKGLKATVDWDRHGMTVVADAPNGRKAWEAFLEHRPEVVITDIVMPEMDGIELSRKIKETAPATKILLLSCHRDFAYAQQGIEVGVSGYLLKTAFEDEEMNRLLACFRDDIHSMQAGRHKQDLQMQTDSGGWNALFYGWLYGVQNEFPRELELRMKSEWPWLNEAHYAYLVSHAETEDAAGAVLREITALLGERVFGIPYGKNRCYLTVGASAKDKLAASLTEWKGRLERFRWMKEGPLQGKDDWMAAVARLHRKAEWEKHYGLETESWPDALTKSVQLVAEQLSHPWSVSEIARRVGLSRSHFSALFKKVTGENVLSFIYRMRLKTACEMLANTDLTLQDIAEQIGMVDGKYFSKWFKRNSGRTPSQYRFEQKGEARRTK